SSDAAAADDVSAGRDGRGSLGPRSLGPHRDQPRDRGASADPPGGEASSPGVPVDEPFARQGQRIDPIPGRDVEPRRATASSPRARTTGGQGSRSNEDQLAGDRHRDADHWLVNHRGNHRGPMRRSIGLLCLLCLLSASTTAWAEPLPEEAHGRFKEGLAAIQAKDWHQALESLSALWQEKRSYDVALLLGQVELNLERYRDAAEHLDFGVRNAAAREAPATPARATQLRELAKEHIGTLEIGANVDAEVRVDGTRVGETPLGSSVFVDPGVRTIQV